MVVQAGMLFYIATKITTNIVEIDANRIKNYACLYDAKPHEGALQAFPDGPFCLV